MRAGRRSARTSTSIRYPVGPARKPTSRRSGGPGYSRWLSFAGGTSVAYVFVHLLPELCAGQRTLQEETGIPPFLEDHVWLVALLGLALSLSRRLYLYVRGPLDALRVRSLARFMVENYTQFVATAPTIVPAEQSAVERSASGLPPAPTPGG